VETLAHHFEQGALWSKAAEYCLRAAEKAKQRYTYPLAREFAWRAHQIGERDGTLLAARASALELLGDVHSLMGDLETANRSYEAALRLARDSAGQRRIESKRHRSGMAMRDGARIAFHQHGQGDETLLFVNPVLWGLEIFQPILEHLCQEFAVITVDARGTGRSDPLQRPYLLADHVADVQAVIEQAGTAAITGIGISRGANLLVWLAHRHPQLVRRLILVGPVPDQMGPDCPVPRLDFAEAAAGFLARDDLDGLVRWLYGRVFSEPATEDIRETWIANVSSLPGETIRSFFDPDPDVDIKPLLPDLRVPTLVIHGVEDRQVSFAAGRYIAEHIAGAELYAFAGRGHMPMFTVTQEFCDVLRRFVRATAAET
jgi:pimeloyl-ACP methyl ester carboxylesterase